MQAAVKIYRTDVIRRPSYMKVITMLLLSFLLIVPYDCIIHMDKI